MLPGRSCPQSKVSLEPTVLQAQKHVGISKVRQCVRVSHVSPDVVIEPFNHRFQTLERAVKERVFRVKSQTGFTETPKPSAGYFQSKLGGFRLALRRFLPKTAPWSHREFVDSYRGRKKEIYEQALVDLYTGYNDIERESAVEVFIKNEKTDRSTKADPVPRVISPRRPLYNLRVGRYLKKIEHPVFKSIGRLFGHPTVMKGYNISETARLLREKWDMLNDPVAVGIDASRFDQHVSMEALEFEHSVYMDTFARKKDRHKLAGLLKWQLENRCTGYTPDGLLKYTTQGTRMSGDMNTSLGNCVLMCGMVWTYLQEKKVVGHLANNGDDCVVFMERKDLNRFSDGLNAWFLKLGFNMVVEPAVAEFGELEFCQTKPIYDGSSWVMCRNPRTAIAKDSVMLSPYQSIGKFLGWLDAVGTGGLSMTGGLPVFQSFYSMYIRSGMRRHIPDELLSWNMLQHRKHGAVRERAVVSDQARLSFWVSYDMEPDVQIELERYYDAMFIAPTLKSGQCMPRVVFPEL